MKILSSYFAHDSNAKDDPKCVLLIEQLGMEGYGIYWMLIETLREQPNYRYPLNLIPALARRYNTTAEKTKAVICSYRLFQIEGDEFFFSRSLIDRMKPLEAKRLIASKAGKASAEKRKINVCSTGVQRAFNEGSTSKVKESKVKQSKVKQSKVNNNIPPISPKGENILKFIKPSIEEVRKYCLERKSSIDAEAFVNFYEAKGWMIGKNKMKDWKAAVRTWERSQKSYPHNPEDIGVVLKDNSTSKYDNDKTW